MKKTRKLKRTTVTDFIGYLAVIAVFVVITMLNGQGSLNRSQQGWLVPVCCYVVMAVSLNLVVGVSGELSLGHAGFMSIGAFSGIITAMSLRTAIPGEFFYVRLPFLAGRLLAIKSSTIWLIVAILVGALFAALAGVLIGIPVLRLRGDYLAIVTLAFGEIIRDLINLLIVGFDQRGLHIILNISGKRTVNDLNLAQKGLAIVKGAQGAVGVKKMATFGMGVVLVLITLVIALNLIRSRSGRAIMAIRDNRIAAESVGINVTKYKMMAFVTSAALAGAAGALYGLNYSTVSAAKFDFNTSIFVLVYVVLGGLGNIWGSVVAATALYILPEALRELQSYRMLVYAIVLILVMLVTNNPLIQQLAETVGGKIKGVFKKKPAQAGEGGARQ